MAQRGAGGNLLCAERCALQRVAGRSLLRRCASRVSRYVCSQCVPCHSVHGSCASAVLQAEPRAGLGATPPKVGRRGERRRGGHRAVTGVRAPMRRAVMPTALPRRQCRRAMRPVSRLSDLYPTLSSLSLCGDAVVTLCGNGPSSTHAPPERIRSMRAAPSHRMHIAQSCRSRAQKPKGAKRWPLRQALRAELSPIRSARQGPRLRVHLRCRLRG